MPLLLLVFRHLHWQKLGPLMANFMVIYKLNMDGIKKLELRDSSGIIVCNLILPIIIFNCNQAIVRRNNAAGSEYFVNAGSATQQGIEAMFKYAVKDQAHSRKWNMHAYTSIAFQPYRFDNYQQGANNYSGNAITGVPRNTWVTGFNLEWMKQIYLKC